MEEAGHDGRVGIKGRRLRTIDRRPRYVITEEEEVFQQAFWQDHGLEGRTVIGVQLQAAESYRDYPHMAALVQRLATEFSVILFHSDTSAIQAGHNIIDPGSISLREAFAVAAACNGIVAPDSAFVHFAAALDIPCVALYGPIDGGVRTKHYPSCVFIDTRNVLQCIPCWRNEVIPCKLTNMRNSACMENLSVDEICAALTRILRKVNMKQRSTITLFGWTGSKESIEKLLQEFSSFLFMAFGKKVEF